MNDDKNDVLELDSEKTDRLINVDIGKEMKKSYIEYAMSVIISRALPDVRDGFKPVHRRILYATMHDLKFYPDKPHRKSVAIVGEVMKNYHPHGDSSIYNAMVRMAQDFSLRYPLIDGQGNFGSIDGYGAAAMRYTEARLAKLSMEMMRDIEKETVDYSPNFDESTKEPDVLPARFPNLLINGSNGIAVGMATSIPPHNIGEVISGIISLIDDPETTIEELMEIIEGPDFPTGGCIIGKSGIRRAYNTGRGNVILRSKCEIDENYKNGNKAAIIITEIPYQVNKTKLLEDIADLVKNKKVDGITALNDASDKTGMKIVIELRRDVNPNVMLNTLFKHTQLQISYSIIMLALVDRGRAPKILNLKSMLTEYIAHQKEVETRRVQFDLRKAQERAHILEGLFVALDNIDEVIRIIRASDDGNSAKAALIERFHLSDIQTQAILDMRLQRLTGIERGKIESEYNELLATIEFLKAVLEDEVKLMGIIKDDLLSIKERFSDDRRSIIMPSETDINYEDLIEEEEVIITLTNQGYIKRVPSSEYASQKRGGRGKSGITTKEEDFVENIFTTSTHDYVLFLTNKGRMYRIKAYNVPETSRTARGTAIVNLLPLQPDESVRSIIPIKSFEDGYLVFGTKKGVVKKTEISQYDTSRKNGIYAITLSEDDDLIEVKTTTGDDDILLVTRNGQSIRFSEEELRPMGRLASGVRGIKLRDGDQAVSLQVVKNVNEDNLTPSLLVVSRNGFGKRTSYSEYRRQKRGGMGLKTYNVTTKTGELIDAISVVSTDEIVMTNNHGVLIRIKIEGLKLLGRVTSGVTLMKCETDSFVVSTAKIYDTEDAENEE